MKPLHLLPLYRSQDLPLLLHIAELKEPDTLPGPCSELSIRYGYAHARTYQRRLNMCLYHRPVSHQSSRHGILVLVYRHIIAPLCIMSVDSFPGCPCNPSAKI